MPEVQSACVSNIMESVSGAEAASSGEQIELELERSTVNDDQSLPMPCAEDNSHKKEEGIYNMINYIIRADQLLIMNLCWFFLAAGVDADDEKPPAYDSLGVAQQELPTVKQKSNSFIGKLVSPSNLVSLILYMLY